jgi:acetyl esterase
MKPILIALMISGICNCLNAQPCDSGKLDPRVAKSLQTFLPDLLPSSTSAEMVKEKMVVSPSFPVGDVEKRTVTSDSIHIQIYNPAHKTDLPVIISFHPGGFVTPMLPFMEYDCWRQAKVYNAIVVAVDYRIAPEHPFPAAVNDAFGAFRWVSDHAGEFGGDTSRIVVLGLSAGGNLAAVVCQKAKEAGLGGRIKLQVLNCPSVDNPLNAATYPSYQQYAKGYFQTKAFSEFYIGVYAPGADLKNPEVAPIQRGDLSGLPSAVVVTAEFDPLRDEGIAYANKLENAGVKVWSKCFAGQIHCLLGLPPESGEQLELDRLVIAAMREVL